MDTANFDHLGSHTPAQTKFFEAVRESCLSDKKETTIVTVTPNLGISVALEHSLTIISLGLNRKRIIIVTTHGVVLIAGIAKTICSLGLGRRIVRYTKTELNIISANANVDDHLSSILKAGNIVSINTMAPSKQLTTAKCDVCIITNSIYGQIHYVPDSTVIVLCR